MPVDTRRTPTSEVRAALVTAAIAVLERDGEKGLTVRAVAAEAKVAPMGVYNHLQDKAGLQLAVVDRGFADLRDAIVTITVDNPEERMRQSGHAYRDLALAHPNVYRLMFGSSIGHESLECPMAAFGALVEQILYCQRAGAIRADDPVDLARIVWASIRGAVILQIEEAGPPVSPEDLTRQYNLLLDMVWHGLATV